MENDEILQVELEAYVDGQLNLERRYAVEDFLAQNPEAAARAMADLRAMTALRLLSSGVKAGGRERATAAELGRVLSRRPLIRRSLRPAAAAAAAVAVAALFALQPFESAARAELVSEALMSHRTALVRAAMTSQEETPSIDPRELALLTGIRIPALLPDWEIRDVQVFPSEEGPALQIMIATPDGRAISFFAAQSRVGGPASPSVLRYGKESVAYWKRGGTYYALTGDQPPEELDATAENLADNVLL